MDQRDAQLLEDMLLEARRAVRYLGDADGDALEADDQRAHAILYAVQIVGEAARNLSKDLKISIARIPWPQVEGMRHVIVHGYRHVSLQVVADTVRNDLPPLIDEIERFLSEHPQR